MNGEKIYERLLKKPLDSAIRLGINKLIQERTGKLPVSVNSAWDGENTLSITSAVVSWKIHFAEQKMSVFAEASSFLGKMFDTPENRRKVVEVLDKVVDQFEL